MLQRRLEFSELCHQQHDPCIVLPLLRPQMFDHLLLRFQNFIRALLNDSGLPFQELFLLLRHHADAHLVLRHDDELIVAVELILREG